MNKLDIQRKFYSTTPSEVIDFFNIEEAHRERRELVNNGYRASVIAGNGIYRVEVYYPSSYQR